LTLHALKIAWQIREVNLHIFLRHYFSILFLIVIIWIINTYLRKYMVRVIRPYWQCLIVNLRILRQNRRCPYRLSGPSVAHIEFKCLRVVRGSSHLPMEFGLESGVFTCWFPRLIQLILFHELNLALLSRRVHTPSTFLKLNLLWHFTVALNVWRVVIFLIIWIVWTWHNF
jgi:hypothetical protein